MRVPGPGIQDHRTLSHEGRCPPGGLWVAAEPARLRENLGHVKPRTHRRALPCGTDSSDPVDRVVMSWAEPPHGLACGERPEPEGERSANIDTTVPLEGRMRGFVIEWVPQDLAHLHVDGALDPCVP